MGHIYSSWSQRSPSFTHRVWLKDFRFPFIGQKEVIFPEHLARSPEA